MSECTRTCKGKVVYKRKKHLFGLSDMVRIGRKSNLQYVSLGISSATFQEIARYVIAVQEAGYHIVFGGGTFGGAGATREFGEPMSVVDISEVRKSDIMLLYKYTLIEEKF